MSGPDAGRSTNPLGLTDREVVCIWSWATGHTTDWLADWIGVSRHTLRSNERRLFQKIGARNKTHATAIVVREILGSAATEQSAVTQTRIANAAREAIRDGADPALTLSYVLWPTDALTAASKKAA